MSVTLCVVYIYCAMTMIVETFCGQFICRPVLSEAVHQWKVLQVLMSFADRTPEFVALVDSFAGFLCLWPLNIQQKAEDSLRANWNMCHTPLRKV
mmetsp:Transcript_13200/g.38006  ORF Transcript_13200/g.38006 Transcript_13200/m.38006 type:complete len:95 (-) Transcript_13200:313-597(-)